MTTLKLYQTEIVPSRNALVEDLDRYLNTLNPRYTSDRFQYQKIAPEMEVKVVMGQSSVGQSEFNYAVINQDHKDFYFFVMGVQWISKNAVKVLLSMDTINTFCRDWEFSPNTQIIREHEDRLFPRADGAKTGEFKYKIDYYNENLEPACDILDDEYDLGDEKDIHVGNFYLVYQTRSGITLNKTANPLSTYICADKPITIYPAIDNTNVGKIGFAELPNRDNIIFITDSGLKNAKVSNELIKDYPFGPIDGTNESRHAIMIERVSGSPDYLQVYGLNYTGDSYPYSFVKKEKLFAAGDAAGRKPVWLYNVRSYMKVEASQFNKEITSLNVIDGLPETIINAGVIPAQQTRAFNTFDRSNEAISKIIKLPYAPVDIVQKSDGSYSFPEGWTFNEGYQMMEKPIAEDVVFHKNIGKKETLLYLGASINSQPTKETERMPHDDYESKLYHSEFYQPRLLYQDIVLPLRMEAINLKSPSITDGYVSFTPHFFFSNSLNSNCLLSVGMSPYYLENRRNELQALTSANTELPLYNSEYVSYLRNGYNFDLASKERTNKMTNINAALGVVSGVISAGAAIGSGVGKAVYGSRAAKAKQEYRANADLGYEALDAAAQPGIPNHEYFDLMDRAYKYFDADVDAKYGVKSWSGVGLTLAGSAISQGVNAISSAIGASMNIENNNRQFAQSLRQQQVAGVSASGLNDTILLEHYNPFKLRLEIWETRAEVRKAIADVFYFTGYSHPVRGLPKLKGRCWFNYIQCDPVFKDQNTKIYAPYLEDIKARFRAGITVYHNNNNKYDWDQTKENWEDWLVK